MLENDPVIYCIKTKKKTSSISETGSGILELVLGFLNWFWNLSETKINKMAI